MLNMWNGEKKLSDLRTRPYNNFSITVGLSGQAVPMTAAASIILQ